MICLHALLLQEQAQAARKRAAGTMDEYTFIAEDAAAADGSVPAIQQVSAEELYRKELAEEMQVALPYTIKKHILHSCNTKKLVCLSFVCCAKFGCKVWVHVHLC